MSIALDHYLATGTGLDFLARTGERRATLRRSSTSPAPTEMSVAVAALKAGAADFVPKTVGEDFLVLLGSALQQAVEKARLRAQKEAAERGSPRGARPRRGAASPKSTTVSPTACRWSRHSSACRPKRHDRKGPRTRSTRHRPASTPSRRCTRASTVRAMCAASHWTSISGLCSSILRPRCAARALARSPTRDRATAGSNRRDHQPWHRRDRMGHQCFQIRLPDHAGEIRVNSVRQLANDEIELAVEDDGIGRR